MRITWFRILVGLDLSIGNWELFQGLGLDNTNIGKRYILSASRYRNDNNKRELTISEPSNADINGVWGKYQTRPKTERLIYFCLEIYFTIIGALNLTQCSFVLGKSFRRYTQHNTRQSSHLITRKNAECS